MGSTLSAYFKRCLGKSKAVAGMLSVGPYLNVQTLGVSRFVILICEYQCKCEGNNSIDKGSGRNFYVE